MRLVVFVALLMPAIAFSECYVVGDLKGYSTREAYDYELSEDGVSSKQITVVIDGQKSSVTPNDMACKQTGKNTVLCVATYNTGETTIETWAVYPEKEKVVHTKTRNGFGSLNGANLFVGGIKGRCE